MGGSALSTTAPGALAGFAAGAALAWLGAAGAPTWTASDEKDQAAAEAMIREGMRQLEAGHADRAIRQFERAVQLAPADPLAYLHLARAHGAAGRAAEAHKVLAKAAIHAHGDKKVLYDVEIARGDIYRGEGKLDAARNAYQKAAGLKFFNREARERLQALETPASQTGKE